MKTVGVKELKAKASELVRRTASGESIVVTVRGKPTAALVPIDQDDLIDHALSRSREIARDLFEADAALEEGDVRPASEVFAELKAEKRRARRKGSSKKRRR